jgi:hypothetical protein
VIVDMTPFFIKPITAIKEKSQEEILILYGFKGRKVLKCMEIAFPRHLAINNLFILAR